MITLQQIQELLEEVAEKINDTRTPQDVLDYMRLRMRVKERLQVEAHDTAHLHAMYVLDSLTAEDVDIVDAFGWELLYNCVSKREKIPLSFARGLTYGLTSDLMVEHIKCTVKMDIVKQSQRILMGIIFDGVKMGLWELKDAQAYADLACPDIPYFVREDWNQQIKQHMGGHVIEDMLDVEIPKGGEDVFLL